MKSLLLRGSIAGLLVVLGSFLFCASSYAVPTSAAVRKAELQQLKSPIWTEQLEAAQKVLERGDAAEVAQLEAFATHPFAPLRSLAAQALARKQVFSPTLKALFYQGADLNWEPTSAGDYALATLASNEVEREAYAGGYKGKNGGAYYPTYDIRDPRIGDLLATRLEKDDFYAVKLFRLSGLPDELLKSAEGPLPPDLKTKVLAAWKAKRASVKNPFTETQLQSEMAQVRRVRYDNFEKGPFYDEVAAIVDEGEKTGFMASAETDKVNARIAALPKEAAPTLFRVFKWRAVSAPPLVALKLLADSEDPGAFVQLAQVAYGRYDGDSRVEAVRLMAGLDFKRAQPHIEAFFKRPFEANDWNEEAPRMGAALVLAARGEKRAVPAFFSSPYERSLIFLEFFDWRVVVSALHRATGLNLPTVDAYRTWWEKEGSKMNWK